MTLIDFEGIADGATLTTANTGANGVIIAAGGSATASTADAVVGSVAGKFVGDASDGSNIVTWPNAATVAVCFAFKFVTGSGAPWGFAYVDSGATEAYKLNYASGTLYSGAWNSGLKVSVATGDVVWISVVLDGTAGTATGHVYDASLSPIATINDTLDATGTFATTNIGAGVGQTTVIDCLTVNPGSTTEIAPGQPSPPVATGPTIRGVIQGGVEVGASLRGVIQSGTEVTATVKEVVGDTSPSGGGGGGGATLADWSDTNLPWAYTSNNDWEQRLPSGATIANIQTGSSDFRTNLQNTINAAGGRVIVRLDDGVYHMDSFDMIGSSGDPLYAMGYWHPNLQGLIGNGPDKTVIQMDADSLTQDQLDAMGNLTSGATGSPLQTGFMRFDGTDLFIGGLTFRADDQQDLTAIDSTVAAYGVQVPQPAPHQGVIFYPGCAGTVSHVRFQAAGRGCMNLPPFEMGNWNSQQTSMEFYNCESDGRKSGDLDPRRPRRSGLGMMNNETLFALTDCWLHHSNLGKFAYNDQNHDTYGTYNLTRCRFNHVSELPNTDPDYGNLGANPNGNRPMGWESCAATINITDCLIEQDRTITAPQYQISLTTITRNPTGGRLTITGSTFTFPDTGTWAYLAEYTALRVVSSNTHWYSDGLANTLHIESPDGNLLTAWTTSSWPPSQSTLNAASVTPSTHYLVFTG